MPAVRKVWDKKGGEDKKGAFVNMYSLAAKEAVKTDPNRYSFDKPAEDEAPAKGKQKEA